MTEDQRRRAFAEAFIAQARSDWIVRRVLTEREGVDVCHELHYLQMVCEKLAKAYRLRDTNSPVDDSHFEAHRVREVRRTLLRGGPQERVPR